MECKNCESLATGDSQYCSFHEEILGIETPDTNPASEEATGGRAMSNFCIDLETGNAFVYEKTLESDYVQGRFGAVPIIDSIGPYKSQFIHHQIDIVEPKKLAAELRKLADKLEAGL